MNAIRLIRVLARYVLNVLQDMVRYVRFSGMVFGDDNKQKCEARILLLAHTLEKGMALPSPRLNFGRERIDSLLSILDRYIKQFGSNGFASLPINVLKAYQSRNVSIGGEPYGRLTDWLDRIEAGTSPAPDSDSYQGGVLKIRKQDVASAVEYVKPEFFNTRYSIRQFSNEDVSLDLIDQAALLAQKTPSVCNRQSGRAYVLTKRQDIEAALKVQGGARGFSEQVNKLIIFTVELGAFRSVGERSQGYIDGGMYAMSFVYALHSMALASCFLNWSKTHAADAELRKLVGIAPSEAIIVLAAVGHMPDEFEVALSARLPIREVVRVI